MNKIRRTFKYLRLYRNPIHYFQAKLSNDRNKTKIVCLRNGARFKLHMGNSDINSVNEVFGTDAYSHFFSKIKQGNTFVDIGANIGTVSVAAGLRGAKVIAFEPNPYVTGLLRENLSLNRVSAVVHEKGVAGRSGKRSFHFVPTMWGGGSLHREDGEAIEIDCVGINDFLDGYGNIDFMKIDIEGGEQEILGSISDKNIRKVKNFFIEYHSPLVSGEFIARKLKKHGFKAGISREFCVTTGERLG